jgi:hypothetical protein
MPITGMIHKDQRDPVKSSINEDTLNSFQFGKGKGGL